MSNLKTIKSIPSIVEIEEIKAGDTVSKFENNALKERALANGEEMYVYEFSYTSQKHKVFGYLAEPRKGSGLPCIVYNRGGSKDFGSLEDEHMFVGRIARFAKEGYIVIASQYSGVKGGEGEDQFGGEDLHDVLNLYKILKAYPRADIDRIGMCGGSRGGLMTYMALTRAKWIKAAIAEFAPSDLFDKEKYRPDFKKHLKRMFGASAEEMKKRSALYWADKFPKNVPILIMHGTADWRVNPMDSLRLAEKLQQNKIPYRLVMFEGADHGITEFRKEAIDENVKWFDKYVKNRVALPNLKPHGL